jgi:GTP-sensing pleiotropic transcriptional regulator CodY
MRVTKKQLNENPAAIIAAVAKYGPIIMQLVDIIEANPGIIDSIQNLMGLKEAAHSTGGATMKITERQLRQIIKEEKASLLSETMNPAMVEIENELRHTLAEYIDTYMMSMNMNPGDAGDRRRVYNRIESITSMIIGN